MAIETRIFHCLHCGQRVWNRPTGKRITGLGYIVHTIDAQRSEHCPDGRQHLATVKKEN